MSNEYTVKNIIHDDAAKSNLIPVSADILRRQSALKKCHNYIRWLIQSKHLILVFLQMELKHNLSRTKLSYIWWLLDPLFSFICYLLLIFFLGAHKHGNVPYPLYMITGVLVWHFTQKSITASVNVWDSNSTLITQLRFPYMCLIISSLLSQLILFMTSQIITILVCVFYGFYPNLNWLDLLAVMVCQSFMLFAVMLIVAQLSFIFHDFFKLLPFILRVWFFLSPIIWNIKMLPKQFHVLIYCNPMTFILNAYRGILFNNAHPAWGMVIMYISITFFIATIAFILFVEREPYISRYV